MNDKEMRTAYFERFALEMELEDAMACSHQGACDDDVEAFLRCNAEFNAQLDAIGEDTLRDELREYGAWDAAELANDLDNRFRIAWLAANNIRDEENA